MNFYFKNFLMFDFLQKKNIQSSYALPLSIKSVLSFSDKAIKANIDLSSITFFSSLPFAFKLPKFTKIKHQSSAFRTRRGDLAGIKSTFSHYTAFTLFLSIFTVLAPELAQIGLTPKFGISESGSFSVSAPNLYFLPFFFQSEISGSTAPLGFDASFSFNCKLPRHYTAALLSGFLFLTFHEN